MDTRRRETLHQQAEALTAALHVRQMQTEPGTPDGDRLRQLVRRSNTRAERRYQASIPKHTP